MCHSLSNLPGSAEWVSEHEQCQGAEDREFSLRSMRWFGGVEEPEPGGDHVEIRAVALQEYSRENENKTQLQTHWTLLS